MWLDRVKRVYGDRLEISWKNFQLEQANSKEGPEWKVWEQPDEHERRSLVAAMAGNHPEYLAEATKDRLHQPHRQDLFPAMKLLFQAAMDAGALGVFLSGTGSTVLALTQGREMTVGYEMAEAAKQAGVEGRLKITQPTVQGAYVSDG